MFIRLMLCIRLKRNGEDSKEIPLIGKEFLSYIDHLYWFLPSPSPKEAYDMKAKKELPADLWSDKRQEIADEHRLQQAPQDLRDGWKAWLKVNRPSKSGLSVTT